MKHLRLFFLPILVALSLSFSNCSSVAPGNDPVVVHAEQTIGIGTDAFTAFLDTEAKLHEPLCSVSPTVCGPVHNFAENLRAPETYLGPNGENIHTRKAKHWLQTATHLLEVYKNDRTPQNKANLQTILSTITAAVAEANTYLGNAYLGKVKGK